MSVNASPVAPPSFPLNTRCFVSQPTSTVFVTFNLANILLLLPLCLFILRHALQQWRRTHPSSSSSSSSSSSLSHSDAFTYHMALMELLRVFGSALCCGGVLGRSRGVLLAGTLQLFYTWYGQTVFHLLTCVERYVAVVHPVTYRNLQGRRGARLRNAVIGFVWLLCFAKVVHLQMDASVLPDLFLLVATLMVVSFCSLSVLRVLVRPGPGEKGRAVERRADGAKRRVFYTITAILGVLAVRLVGSVMWAVLHLVGGPGYCVLVVSEIWINLSSSLVLPLLFLLREGKLRRRHGNAQH